MDAIAILREKLRGIYSSHSSPVYLFGLWQNEAGALAILNTEKAFDYYGLDQEQVEYLFGDALKDRGAHHPEFQLLLRLTGMKEVLFEGPVLLF